MIYKSFNELSNIELKEIYELRQRVFIIEQSIIDMDIDEYDLNATHIFIKQDGKIVSYARLIDKKGQMYIGRVVTDKNYRKKGFSTMIIKSILDRYDSLALSSQIEAIDFYKKLGFQIVGKKYKEAGLMHQKMVFIK